MFMAMELVSDKKLKTPLTGKVTDRIFHECVKRGLLTMAYSAHFRIQPPLTTDMQTAMNGLAILKEVFDLVERETWWRQE
jgi:4-aminobutyrate aminotransferase-like enzyme